MEAENVIRTQVAISRARRGLLWAFVGDALSMPVHWFYNPNDIVRTFPPKGITRFEAAPGNHPSSIMNLHSTTHGGRKGAVNAAEAKQIVGDVILKGKAKFWGVRNMHYHQGLPAGENTLNAYCARLLMRTLTQSGSAGYQQDAFLKNYISFMTADPPQHPDTYAESYHRGFFANLIAGSPPDRCGALTHDTPSMGGLVTIVPLVISELLRTPTEIDRVKALAGNHLQLTHPDKGALLQATYEYVDIVSALLFSPATDSKSASGTTELIQKFATKYFRGADRRFFESARDEEVVGGLFSTACYITDSWPSLLFLAQRYWNDPAEALIRNTNLGGENCHRGFVLGSIVGLASREGQDPDPSRFKLLHEAAIEAEIADFLSTSSGPKPKQATTKM